MCISVSRCNALELMASLVGVQTSHMVLSAITWISRQQWSNWEGKEVWAWLDKAAQTLMKLLSGESVWGWEVVQDVICHTIWIFRRAGERPPLHMSACFASESYLWQSRGEGEGKKSAEAQEQGFLSLRSILDKLRPQEKRNSTNRWQLW